MAGLQTDIYASVFITMTAAVVVLALRLTARRMTKQRLWYDDYFAMVAFVFAIAYCTVIVVDATHYRLGRTVDFPRTDRGERTVQESRLLLWIGSLTYASSIAASKVSFLSFYWRIFQFTSIRIPIQILLVTSAVWIIVRTFLTIFQCHPVQAIWDKTIRDANCPIDQSKFFFGSVLVHCLMDVVILLLPIFPVSQMHLTWSKKMGVVALFSFGAVVCVASVFVLIESITQDSSTERTIPPEAARNWLWAAVEVNMAVFSGSLPMLRPIIRRVFPSFMAGSGHQPTYEEWTGIRLSRTEDARKQQIGQEISSRKMSRPKPSKPSWADLVEDGSGPSIGPAQVTVDKDHDHDYDNDDDESDLWRSRECDIGHDTRRDDMQAGRIPVSMHV